MSGARCLGWAGSLAVAIGLAGVGLTSTAVSWAESSVSGAGATSESVQSSGRSPSEDGSPSGGAYSADRDDNPSGGSGSAESDADDESDSFGSVADEIGDDEATDDQKDVDDVADDPATDESAEEDEAALGEDAVSEDDRSTYRAIEPAAAPATGEDEGSASQADETELAEPVAVAAEVESPVQLEATGQPQAIPSPPSATTPGSVPDQAETLEAARTTVGDAPQTAAAALTPLVLPGVPSSPATSPAPLAVYASTRREGEQSVTKTIDSGTPQAGVAATAAVTRSPVSPAAPASIATAIQSMVTAVQSWIQRTFFAASPTFPPQTVSMRIDPGTTSPPFTLAAEDADGRPLTYTIDGAATGSGSATGTLRISGGSATYTPPPGWDGATPYTDTFTVTASDADGSFHIHGIAGLIHALTFGLFGSSGHSATSTGTVNVAAAESEPPETPVPAGSFPVSVNNNTGAYGDDEVHLMVIGQNSPGRWAWVDRNGTAHALDHTAADAPGHLEKDGVNYADMTFTAAEADNLRIPPELLGGRIYVSLGAPLYIAISADNNGWASPDPANPADPNYQSVYDWYELSFKDGSVPFGGNTTQVDQFGFPFTFTLTQDSSGFSGTRGIALTRDEVFQRFKDTVPAAFQALVIKDIDGDPIRILAPRSQQPGELTTWFDEPIDAFWTKYRTEQFVYAGPGYTVTGGIDTDDGFAYTVSTLAGASTTHIMDKPATTDVFRADGPFTGTALQGAFLAELNAAFNRGVATSPGDWNDTSAYYPAGQRWNNWAQFFHSNSVQGYAYGFPYDDVNSQSSVLILDNSEPLTDLALTLTAQR